MSGKSFHTDQFLARWTFHLLYLSPPSSIFSCLFNYYQTSGMSGNFILNYSVLGANYFSRPGRDF